MNKGTPARCQQDPQVGNREEGKFSCHLLSSVCSLSEPLRLWEVTGVSSVEAVSTQCHHIAGAAATADVV
jgi:hypothetical protein